jgi:hypothetical protein
LRAAVEIAALAFCSLFSFVVRAQPIMPKPKKRRRHSRRAHASKKRKKRLANSWRNQLEVFSDFCQEIKNPNGRSRTYEENKLLILALRAYLRQKVKSMNEGDLHPSSITWRSIEEAVAGDFFVRREHLTELRRIFLDEGDVRKMHEAAPPRTTTTPSNKRFPVNTLRRWSSTLTSSTQKGVL